MAHTQQESLLDKILKLPGSAPVPGSLQIPQDGASLTPFVTTARIAVPGRLVRFFYRRFTRHEYEDPPPDLDLAVAYDVVLENVSDRGMAEFQ